ncbi:hypothetical protein [Oceanirhabdus sp. W0125-5]|uniref:hypothetical protein n=1 Tax=Oceanirhabdus sp. W0125-5 TaxID=2999116 RepID=UPI0022F31B51|nr:hypothetical protein [Oceanirhabdus sp. W0125-5]WBW96911.1 hypothetical protein OW730_24955 [Oceanirhabdus sp. W0125-5]
MEDKIKRKNAIEYIEYGLNRLTKDSKKHLKNSLIIMLMFSLPIMIFGKWNIFILLIIGIQLVLLIKFNFQIKKEVEKRKRDYILYSGLDGLFISEILMLGSWKFFSVVYDEKIVISIILIILYSIPNILILRYGVNKVNKGLKKKKSKYATLGTGFFGGMGVLGMGFCKAIFKDVSQDKAMLIMGILLLILGMMFSLSSSLIQKYYFCKKYKISSKEINEQIDEFII